MDNYKIDKDEWPEDAISLKKHIELKTTNNKKIITLTYTFVKSDGSNEVKTKEFIEDA